MEQLGKLASEREIYKVRREDDIFYLTDIAPRGSLIPGKKVKMLGREREVYLYEQLMFIFITGEFLSDFSETANIQILDSTKISVYDFMRTRKDRFHLITSNNRNVKLGKNLENLIFKEMCVEEIAEEFFEIPDVHPYNSKLKRKIVLQDGCVWVSDCTTVLELMDGFNGPFQICSKKFAPSDLDEREQTGICHVVMNGVQEFAEELKNLKSLIDYIRDGHGLIYGDIVGYVSVMLDAEAKAMYELERPACVHVLHATTEKSNSIKDLRGKVVGELLGTGEFGDFGSGAVDFVSKATYYVKPAGSDLVARVEEFIDLEYGASDINVVSMLRGIRNGIENKSIPEPGYITVTPSGNIVMCVINDEIWLGEGYENYYHEFNIPREAKKHGVVKGNALAFQKDCLIELPDAKIPREEYQADCASDDDEDEGCTDFSFYGCSDIIVTSNYSRRSAKFKVCDGMFIGDISDVRLIESNFKVVCHVGKTEVHAYPAEGRAKWIRKARNESEWVKPDKSKSPQPEEFEAWYVKHWTQDSTKITIIPFFTKKQLAVWGEQLYYREGPTNRMGQFLVGTHMRIQGRGKKNGEPLNRDPAIEAICDRVSNSDTKITADEINEIMKFMAKTVWIDMNLYNKLLVTLGF
jgi:hypothetical protein